MKLEKLLAENMLRFGTKNLSAALKQKLTEQVTQQIGADKHIYGMTDDEAAILRVSPALKTSINKKSNITPIETGDTRTDQSTAWRLELRNKFGQEVYNKFIQSLAKGNSENNANIWYLQLTQESRLAFLTQFNAYITALAKRKQNDDYKVNLAKGKVTREKVEPIGAPVLEPITLGINVSGKDVFVDNQSVITPIIQAAINQLVADAKAALGAIAGTDGKIKVTELSVAASASRFRNTGAAAKDTWAQLSQKRAGNVKTEIVNQLTALGITVPPSVISLRGGYNKDGTTGPNPPVGFNLSPDGIAINNDETKRGEFGAPLASKEAYDQFKFLVVTCTAEVTYTTPVTEIPDEVSSRGYNMLITAYKKPGTYKFPLRVSWLKLNKSMPSVSIGTSATPTMRNCPVWSE